MGLGTGLIGREGMFGKVLGISKCMKRGFGFRCLKWEKMGIMIIGHFLLKWTKQTYHIEHKGPVKNCFGLSHGLAVVLALW